MIPKINKKRNSQLLFYCLVINISQTGVFFAPEKADNEKIVV